MKMTKNFNNTLPCNISVHTTPMSQVLLDKDKTILVGEPAITRLSVDTNHLGASPEDGTTKRRDVVGMCCLTKCAQSF